MKSQQPTDHLSLKQIQKQEAQPGCSCKACRTRRLLKQGGMKAG